MAGMSQAAGPIVKPQAHPASKIDWPLLIATIVLLVVGFMSLYSIDSAGASSHYFFKQLLRLAIGMAPFFLFLWISPRVLVKYASAIYFVNVGLLALVLIIGSRAGGAQRWLALGPVDFQPSEMAKLFLVISLAAFYVSRLDRIRSLSTFLLSLFHIAVPVFLIFKQPHLGATLVVIVVWLGVSLIAGVPTKFLIGALIAVVALLTAAIRFGWLPDYQLERLWAMLGSGDARGNKFQVLRAQYAFAAGGLTGVGFMKGEQKRAAFVPEQHTDFIFTVIGEEGGLVGCTLVLAAYGLFFQRIWRIMVRSKDEFSRMIAAGIFTVLGFHTVVNIGMNLELLPVVGLWLPFMSYGGTAIWLCLASVGLLLNLQMRERPVIF